MKFVKISQEELLHLLECADARQIEKAGKFLQRSDCHKCRYRAAGYSDSSVCCYYGSGECDPLGECEQFELKGTCNNS